MLTVAEAVKILSKKNITHSEEMVRRWIRKGKIKDAVKFSNKEGWLIPEDSLEEVIAAKTYMNSGIKSTKEYRKGYQDALAYIKERDYELIKQSPPVYEKEFTIYRDDALDLAENMLPEEQLANPFKKFVDDTLFRCSHAEPLSSIVVKVLNNWVLVEDTNDIYNIAKLPNLNVTFEDHLTRALLRDQFNTFKRTSLAI
ncbi:MAG TPA: helix-turn-helix domain-containing protein [Trichococcus sp.]|nr:helix-turn-helix domain-containing protein [Trichococcus sp.]